MIIAKAIATGDNVQVNTVVHGEAPTIAKELVGLTANVLKELKGSLVEGTTLEDIAHHIMDMAIEQANCTQ